MRAPRFRGTRWSLAFDALHIHLFLKSNQMSLLKRTTSLTAATFPAS